jgi:lipopolysaccharide transport system ATP-binding protein
MALIRADAVTVDFPIYGVKSRSFKTSLINAAIGGRFAKTASDHVTVRALDSLSFEFHEGDRVGLIGHNGSGKSTLLRVLAGIYEPTAGKISTLGKVTSMLSIFLGMDMEASGYENIILRGRVMGVPARKMNSMIDDIAEFSGIGDYLHLPMRTYSSGMAMRLAFAASTSVDADIILMDEWLSVGDADFAKKAKERLDSMMSGAKIVIIASHNIDLIKNQCNRVLTLEYGKIIDSSG